MGAPVRRQAPALLDGDQSHRVFRHTIPPSIITEMCQGTMGNLGMYASGIPVGLLVDAKGPRPGVFIGSIFVGTGYFGIYKAHAGGEGSIALPWLCFFAVLTGIGGASAFAGSIKTCAVGSSIN